MYGRPTSAAIFATFSAITQACNSLSITHGPAIRNSGFPAPRRSLPNSISRAVPIRLTKIAQEYQAMSTASAISHVVFSKSTTRPRGKKTRLDFYALVLGNAQSGRARTLLLVFQRCADERRKQWMRLERLGLELRMELAAEEPGMIGSLDNLYIILIRRASGNFQSRVHQRFLEVAVEFIAMAVAFADLQLTVGLVRERPWLELARPRTQPHRAAHFVHAEQFAQFVNHTVRRLRIKLRAVCMFQAGKVACIFNCRALHPQANPEERHFVLARVLNGINHSLNPTPAEPAGHEDPVVAVEPPRGRFQ